MSATSSRCFPRRPARLALRLALLASSALLLTACTAGGKLSTWRAGDVPAGEPRALPAFCEDILKPVPVTKATAKTDARLAYVRAADERDEANDRLTVGSMCIRDERADYAGRVPADKKEKPK